MATARRTKARRPSGRKRVAPRRRRRRRARRGLRGIRLHQRHYDVLGLALAAIGILLGFVIYAHWDGGSGGDSFARALGWLFGKARLGMPVAIGGAGVILWMRPVLPPLGVPMHKNFNWLPERQEISAEVKRKWLGDNSKFKIQNSKLILLQPGARWENKRWPANYFAELVRSLAQTFQDARFAILGSGEDQPLGEIILSAAPERCLNLCGKTSLPEMIEWVRRCDLLVTNDTGPMHAAAALGKPLVALFGPTEPRRTGPYGQLENVLRLDLPCSPCLKATCHFEKPDECLRALSPALVLVKIHEVMT